MEEIGTLYVIILPIVFGAGVLEALWLQRSRREGYDWQAWACSLADLAGRRVLGFIPYTLAAPWLAIHFRPPLIA